MTAEPRYYANISELQEATDSKAANILLASGWELLSVKERSSALNGPNGIVRDGEVCYVFGRQSSKVTGATDNVSQQAPVVGAQTSKAGKAGSGSTATSLGDMSKPSGQGPTAGSSMNNSTAPASSSPAPRPEPSAFSKLPWKSSPYGEWVFADKSPELVAKIGTAKSWKGVDGYTYSLSKDRKLINRSKK